MTDHDTRMHELLYSNDGRVELCERIVALEELVLDMYRFIHAACGKYPRMFDPNLGGGGQMVREMPDVRYASEMRELGIEV